MSMRVDTSAYDKMTHKGVSKWQKQADLPKVWYYPSITSN